MSVTRQQVFERLAATSDAATRRKTSVEAIASALGADEGTVEDHLRHLADCELARIDPDGSVRVTITGQELLELDVDETVIVDPS